MSLRKEFSSLKKSRTGGVIPQNNLASPVQKISIPTEDTINRGGLYVVKPLSIDDKKRSKEVQTCFHYTVSLQDAGLAERPQFSVALSSVDYNGTDIIALDGENDLVLSVSHDGRYIFFKKGISFIDKLVLPEKKSLKAATFDGVFSEALLVIHQNFGYVHIKFRRPDRRLYQFFTENTDRWGTEKLNVSSSALSKRHSHESAKRESFQKDPETIVQIEHSPPPPEAVEDPKSDVLKNGAYTSLIQLPKKLVYSRQTRSVSQLAKENPDAMHHSTLEGKYKEESSDVDTFEPEDGEPIIRETPAPFDPPLRYSIEGEKKFSITSNDFKTLYNNDWINDTLIDFFIAFEIDRAVNIHKSIRRDEVYAFNSFFFTKLLSKPEDSFVPDYFGNIRRWVTKIDLMKYESVIIPINEHLHWYCVIIKNLPRLLATALENPGNEDAKTEGAEQKKRYVDIFVVDSLRQNHSNIGLPLKTVIKEYCREKHGVDINTAFIRIVHAHVSRQRNFNDCGIHVIYNIRKWLGNPSMCETIWRKPAKIKNNYFSGAERSGMRKECIDLLIDLHSKQPADINERQSNSPEGEGSDDEIELISYHTSKVIDEAEAKPAEAAEGSSNAEDAASDAKEPVSSTNKDDEGKNSLSAEHGTTEEKQIAPEDKTRSEPPEDVASKALSSQNSDDKGKENHYISDKSDGKHSGLVTQYRTLDPRASGEVINLSSQSTPAKKAGTPQLAEHPQVRKLCLRLRLKPHTKRFLDSYFVDHDKKYREDKQSSILAFVEKYNLMDPAVQGGELTKLEEKLKEKLKEPRAPMYESFVIEEADDSGGELNRSVGDLRISSSTKSRGQNSTPEATRVFLRQADEPSPIGNSSPISSLGAKLTRSKMRSFFEGSESDIEILDDALEILPGQPGSHSSPSTRAGRQPTAATPPKGRGDSREVVTIPDDDQGSIVTLDSRTASREWNASKRRRVD